MSFSTLFWPYIVSKVWYMYVIFNNVQFYQKKKSHATDALQPNWFMFGFCSLSDFFSLFLNKLSSLFLNKLHVPSQAGAIQFILVEWRKLCPSAQLYRKSKCKYGFGLKYIQVHNQYNVYTHNYKYVYIHTFIYINSSMPDYSNRISPRNDSPLALSLWFTCVFSSVQSQTDHSVTPESTQTVDPIPWHQLVAVSTLVLS